MLRLTVTVVQVMSDAHVLVTVHQEDPYGSAQPLGEVRSVYDMTSALERWDEVTALVSVLRDWSGQVLT